MLLYGVGVSSRHLMVSDEEQVANLTTRSHWGVLRRQLRSDLIHRPGDGTSLRERSGVSTRPENLFSLLLSSQAAARTAGLAFSATNLVPSTHIRWRTTASLRANATLAFFIPARLASLVAQLFSDEPFTGRVKMM